MSADHWAAAYIGSPWIAGEHDCWGFVRRVYREQFGLDVAAVDIDATSLSAALRAFDRHPEFCHWQAVATHRDGDAVLMGKGLRPAHVGLWCEADGGGVLHAIEGAGVVFQCPAALAASGWRILASYRRAP